MHESKRRGPAGALVAVMAFVLSVSVGCNRTPRFDGSFQGEFSGAYTGVGRVEDGTATSTRTTFSGSTAVSGRREGDRVVFEFGACTLRVTVGADGTSAADPLYEGAPCTWDMGAPVGPVALSPLSVSASVTETELTLDWNATAPPPEEGANPAQVTWTFRGTRQ